MFFRIQKKPSGNYLTLAQTYRENGKIKHQHIASLGRVDKLNQNGTLYKLAQKLLQLSNQRNHYDISTMEEEDRRLWGPVAVVKAVWKQFKLDNFFQKIVQDKKIQYKLVSCLFLLALDRIMQPQSRLQSWHNQHKWWELEEVELHQLYRALDVAAGCKQKLEDHLFQCQKTLFGMRVEVVLYDVTTLFFESVQPDEDEEGLKDFGYSKDGKSGEVQVVFGLLLNSEGRPIGFEAFRGNTYEGHTLEQVVGDLKKRFEIQRVVVVADRGMLSEANLKRLEDLGYEYIVGYRLKSAKKQIQQQALDPEGYQYFGQAPASSSSPSAAQQQESQQNSSSCSSDPSELCRYKQIQLEGGRKLLVVYSPQRAKKEKQDRQRLIDKAQQVIEKGQVKARLSRGTMRYVDISTDQKPQLAQQKIEEDEKWDGYYAILSNTKDLSGPAIWQQYRELWKIEQAFRNFKHHMELRPMFVWTTKRIMGHLTVAFLAYVLQKHILLTLEEQGIHISEQQLRQTLADLQVSTLQIEGETFLLRSKVSSQARSILKTFGVSIPPSLTQKENFKV